MVDEWKLDLKYFCLLMAGGIFLCLNQVMLTFLRRHQGLVLDHCKNEQRHRYTKTKSAQIPGSLHLQWARGEEYSWSSWRCRSVATDRSSHPVGLSEEEERKWLIAFLSLLLSFLCTLPPSTHFTASLSILPLCWNCNVNWIASPINSDRSHFLSQF